MTHEFLFFLVVDGKIEKTYAHLEDFPYPIIYPKESKVRFHADWDEAEVISATHDFQNDLVQIVLDNYPITGEQGEEFDKMIHEVGWHEIK